MRQFLARVVDHDGDQLAAADLASDLRILLEEMKQVERIDHPESMTPGGSKGSALEWAQLVVAFAGALGPLIAAIRGWQKRNRSPSVHISLDGDELRLEGATPEEQEALVTRFLERHPE